MGYIDRDGCHFDRALDACSKRTAGLDGFRATKSLSLDDQRSGTVYMKRVARRCCFAR